MRSCKKYLLLLGLLLMAAVGGCGGIGYEETDENKPVTIKGPEGLPTNPKILIAYFSTYWEYSVFFQFVSYHAVLVFIIVPMLGKVFVYFYKSLGSVIIISVYYGKRSIYKMPAGEHCMGCPPWLFPSLRNLRVFRNIIKFLIGILYIHIPAGSFIHKFSENLPVFFLYDKYSSVEACHHRIVK